MIFMVVYMRMAPFLCLNANSDDVDTHRIAALNTDDAGCTDDSGAVWGTEPTLEVVSTGSGKSRGHRAGETDTSQGCKQTNMVSLSPFNVHPQQIRPFAHRPSQSVPGARPQRRVRARERLKLREREGGETGPDSGEILDINRLNWSEEFHAKFTAVGHFSRPKKEEDTKDVGVAFFTSHGRSQSQKKKSCFHLIRSRPSPCSELDLSPPSVVAVAAPVGVGHLRCSHCIDAFLFFPPLLP